MADDLDDLEALDLEEADGKLGELEQDDSEEEGVV